jgi:exopolyphosphatase/pppGpp-phosphohydrolase/predicted RNA-binding protein with RPS1 domain
MLGRAPFSVVGGGSPEENIKKGIFPYPLGENENQGVPKGQWEFLWRSMLFEVKELFSSVFSQQAQQEQRPSLTSWRSAIQSYRNAILEGRVSRALWPEQLKDIITNRTVKIDDGRKKGTGNSENIWVPTGSPRKVAVLELSTRAVKLLIGDRSKLEDSFSWPAFRNEAHLTYTGTLLDSSNTLSIPGFRERVLPRIKQLLSVAKKAGVERLYCIATAAYRSATNRNEILRILKEELNLNSQILDRREEAKATILAYLWSTTQVYRQEDKIVLIDQGGGSTEVSIFDKNGRILDSAPIPVGTTSAINSMFVNAYCETSLDSILAEGVKAPRNSILRNTRSLTKQGPFAAVIGVGTAITKTKQGNNRSQHESYLTTSRISEVYQRNRDSILNTFSGIEELFEAVEKSKLETKTNSLYSKLITLVGLFMFQEILSRLNSSGITINGTGLRYGVFFEKTRSLPFPKPKSYGALRERTINQGIVSGFQNYGVFVNIGTVTGLIYISQFRRLKIEPTDFLKINKPIRVFIDSLSESSGRLRVELSLWDNNENLLIEEELENWRKREPVTYKEFQERTVVRGLVKKILSFGVFVNLGSLDGLIHISQFERLQKSPESILNAFQEIDVFISQIIVPSAEGKVKISLSLWNDEGKCLLHI